MLIPPPLNRLSPFLDLPIRFLYTQTPIAPFAQRLLFPHLYSSKPTHSQQVFHQAQKLWRQHHLSVRHKVILELGPGNSIITALNFLASGASHVIQVDKFPRQFHHPSYQQFRHQEITFFRHTHPHQSFPFLKKNHLSSYLTYIPADPQTLTLSQPVDVIYSISVLEHVKHLRFTLTRLASLLSPSGFAFHRIDLRDHFDFSHPFLFYKYSPSTWNRWLTKEGISYTNRVRYHQYRRLFRHLHLHTLTQQTTTTPLPPSLHLHSHFQSHPRSSLTTTTLTTLLTPKPRHP